MNMAASLLKCSDVRVIPQPMGPYFEMAFDENGMPVAARNEESWGVVEIGYFTTDFMLMMDGRWVEKASGACAGARVAAEHLQRILGEKGISADLPECEEALRKKFIRNFTKRIDVTDDVNEAVSILANEVIDTATRLMEPYARKIDGIIVAGGGADFMYEKIRTRWPHAVTPGVPRMSVAEGMRRFASMSSVKDAIGQASVGE
jgi:plasmid segregation protein ParM